MSRFSFAVACGSLLLSARLLVESPASAQTSAMQFTFGETIELESRLLNEKRRLIIGKPYSYETSDDRYPVSYLLVGRDHFD